MIGNCNFCKKNSMERAETDYNSEFRRIGNMNGMIQEKLRRHHVRPFTLGDDKAQEGGA